MSKLLEATPNIDRVLSSGAPFKLDREAGVIHGAILAETGSFETKGRGQFTDDSLLAIKSLIDAEPQGLKARWTHPMLSDDGLGKFLGRYKDPYITSGQLRANLHFSETAQSPTPESGGVAYADYIFDLAAEDPAAFENSLAISDLKTEYLKDDDGELATDESGDPLPPVWTPLSLTACDVVCEGDATHNGFLSRRNGAGQIDMAVSALDHLLGGQPRDVVEARINAFVERYLSNRFEEEPKMENQNTPATLSADEIRAIVADQMKDSLAEVNKLNESLAAQQAKREAEDRARVITALCTEAGCADKAIELIEDNSLSVADVRQKLWAQMIESQQLTAGAPADLAPSGDEKYRKEYLEQESALLKIGCTMEMYIADRKREELGVKPDNQNPLVCGVSLV